MNLYSVLNASHSLSSILTAINPGEGDLDSRHAAKQEFEAFVMNVYEQLYKMESRAIGGRSTIGTFCRIDVGLIFNTEFHYFVNEVERTPTTSLWSNRQIRSGSNPIGILGATFAKSLHKWLTDIDNAFVTY